jgi:hypothetical protein
MRQCVGLVEPAEAFADSPVDARLAAALVAVEALCSQRNVQDPQVNELIDHLWSWLTVDETNFQEWYAFDSPLLEAGLGAELPDETAEAFAQVGVNREALRRLVMGLIEILYGNLFAAIDDDATQAHMEAVAEVLAELGIAWPSRARFPLRDGQARPHAEDVAHWRRNT